MKKWTNSIEGRPGSVKKERLYLLFILLIVLIQGIFIYLYLIRPQGPFCWDEAHRSVFSLMVAKSFLSGNISMLWQLTNQQIYWPFLHSWASSIFLIVGGFSYPAARTMSLTMNAGALITIYFIARKVTGRTGGGVELIAAGLFALSPIFAFFAATAMAESLGIFLSLLVLFFYLTSWQKNSRSGFLLTGALLGLLYFTKYIYAVFFGFGLVLFWLSLLFDRERKEEDRNLFRTIWLVSISFGVIIGLWLAVGQSGGKIGILVYRFKSTGGWDFLKLGIIDRILFYPRALLIAYSFSPWLFPAYLAGLAWGFCHWKDLKIRLLLLIFLGNLLPMAVSANLQERFIATSAPALFILTAIFLVNFWKRPGRKILRPILLVWLILIIGDIYKMPGYIRIIGNTTLGVLNFNAPKKRPAASLFGLLPHPSFFRQPTNLLSPKKDDPVASHTIEDIYQFIWKNADHREPICALFQLNSASPHIWQWHAIVRHRQITTNFNPRCSYFITLTFSPDSIYRTTTNKGLIEDRTDKTRQLLQFLEDRKLLRLWKEKKFADLGITATIYARVVPSDHPAWKQLNFGEISR